MSFVNTEAAVVVVGKYLIVSGVDPDCGAHKYKSYVEPEVAFDKQLELALPNGSVTTFAVNARKQKDGKWFVQGKISQDGSPPEPSKPVDNSEEAERFLRNIAVLIRSSFGECYENLRFDLATETLNLESL